MYVDAFILSICIARIFKFRTIFKKYFVTFLRAKHFFFYFEGEMRDYKLIDNTLNFIQDKNEFLLSNQH